MQKLLTIAIPVYNGSSTLSETIESVISQNENINILISDNASTDATSTIANEYAAKYDNVYYSRNEENVGYDRNFEICFQKSNTDFVWLLGDDDIVRPGAIKKVLETLEQYGNLGFIYVNYAMVNRQTNEVTKDRDLLIYQDTYISAGEGCFDLLGEYPNFISTLIFRRDTWNAVDKQKYFGSLYVQYAVFLAVTWKYDAYIISEPFIENKRRTENYEHKPEFYSKYFDNFYSLYKVIDEHHVFAKHKKLKNKKLREIVNRHLYKYIRVHKNNGGNFQLHHLIFVVRLIPKSYWSFLYILLMIMPIELYTSIKNLRKTWRFKN